MYGNIGEPKKLSKSLSMKMIEELTLKISYMLPYAKNTTNRGLSVLHTLFKEGI